LIEQYHEQSIVIRVAAQSFRPHILFISIVFKCAIYTIISTITQNLPATAVSNPSNPAIAPGVKSICMKVLIGSS